jgi:hypothetical membrane protein
MHSPYKPSIADQKLSHERIIWGAVALTGIIEYVITEAVTAFAWKNPAYSYVYNYISDLGVSGPPIRFSGRLIYSPWFRLMNSGFIVEGALTVLAACLLTPLLKNKKWRRIIPLLAITHALGITLVGIVHGSPTSLQEKISALHVIGAFLAIVFGNITNICMGIASWHSGAPKWYAIYSINLGILGLLSLVALATIKSIPPGITERCSVYTITVWDVSTGLLLLFGHKKNGGVKFPQTII